MKRVAAIIVVFMLLGVFISIAVAWAWAAWGGVKEFDPQLTARLRRQGWRSQDPSGGGTVEDIWIRQVFADAGGEIVELKLSDSITSAEMAVSEHRFGWPWRCVRAEERQPAGTFVIAQPVVRGGVRLTKTVDIHMELAASGGMTVARNRVLPWLPMWSGLLADSAVFGTFAFVLFAIPFAIRRLVRRLRRQCGHCGYPIGVSAVCTECGGAVRPRHVAIPGKMEP